MTSDANTELRLNIILDALRDEYLKGYKAGGMFVVRYLKAINPDIVESDWEKIIDAMIDKYNQAYAEYHSRKESNDSK